MLGGVTTRLGPMCLGCARLHDQGSLKFYGRTCDAFPDGIPAAIWEDAGDHRKPFPGDHGIQYAEGAFGPLPSYFDEPRVTSKGRSPSRPPR